MHGYTVMLDSDDQERVAPKQPKQPPALVDDSVSSGQNSRLGAATHVDFCELSATLTALQNCKPGELACWPSVRRPAAVASKLCEAKRQAGYARSRMPSE